MGFVPVVTMARSRRRASTIDADQLRRLQDQRSAGDLLEEIPERVGTDPIPSRLSRETIVESIGRLARSDVARATAAPMNERQLRIWLADLCRINYDPTDDRGLNYRREELLQIDQTLENHIDGGVQG